MRSRVRAGGTGRSRFGIMERRPLLMLAAVFMLFASSLSLITTSVPAEASPGGTPEIMLVGDSITYGTDSTGTVGFRRALFQSLEATHGVDSFEFVGSQTDGSPDDFDRSHEGHSGWEADEIESNIIGWLNANPADIVALHIGTNDISAGDSVAEIVGDIDDTLDNIDTWESTNHSVWVVLARIINRSNPTDTLGERTTELNEAIQILADARIASGDQIVVVDMEPALDYPADMDDSVHPNDSGYSKMAPVYDAAIDPLLAAWSSPLVDNVVLSPAPADVSEDLSCAFDLTGDTSATAWTVGGSPLATLLLPMEGGAAAALEDVSGNGNDVAPYDDPTWVADAGHDGNGAFVFDGGDDLHAEGVFPVGSSYTKTAWVYRTGSGNSGGNNIISGDTNGGGHALWARDSYGNKLSAGHNGTWNSVIDSEALALNTWFHVALTWDSSTGLMSLYKNGALVSGSGAVPTATITAPVTDDTVSIGSFGSAGHSWVGTIDDATVYPVALSADQIAALYANGDSNTVVAAETTAGEVWQCQVTPFSDTEAGTTVASNTSSIATGGPDTTDPVVTITTPVDGAEYDLDEVVLADFECTDAQSGIASCVGDVADGAAIDTSTLGAKTFTVTGVDNAANDTVVVHNYTVVVASGPLVENVVLTPDPADVSEDLSCAFDLTTGSTTATAWSVGSSPLATFMLPMEGGATAALLDYSGNNNDAATYGDPSWVADGGHDGNGAFALDGNDDLHAGEVFPVGSSYTKAAWVYRTGSGGNNIISGNENGGGHAFWAANSDRISAGHNGSWYSVIDSEALAADTWYHVAVTWDSATGLMSLYKNGALVSGSGAVPTATVTAAVTDTTVSIGSFGSSNGYFWTGMFDDVALYPVALSADQIAALYAAGVGDANTVVAAETTAGEVWQCQVTPFSDSEAGTTVASNTSSITTGGPDTTDPVVTITTPVDGAEYDLDEVVLADFECTDAESGIDTCTGDVADGAAIDTATLGAKTFTVTGVDNAANDTVVTHDYTVVVASGPLVENVVLSPDPADVSEDLSCAFDLTGDTSATVWSVDASPLATLVLPMEGGATAALEDVSGNSHSVTVSGDPSWSAIGGHDGNGAFVFDGNDALRMGDVLPAGSSYTKSAWVYRTADANNNIMSGNSAHAFWAAGNVLSAGHNGDWDAVIDSEDLALNTWFHVAVTWDAATGDMVLYKNAVIIDSDTQSAMSDEAVNIGSYGSGHNWNGTIDDARLYRVALSADQIAAMYASGAGDSNTVVAAETTAGEVWQCHVTPFSDTEAGTTVASNTSTITINDTTDPVVTITTPAEGATYDLGAVVPAEYDCTDSESGIASCTGDVPDGDPIDTATEGAKTFTVTGIDNVGNDTVVTHNYSVVDLPGPTVENVGLSSSPAGGGVETDDLSCAFDLAGAASTSATAWTVDASPLATFVLPMEGGATAALEDVSGNGNDASVGSDPVWSATGGHDGYGAFEFDGNDYLDPGAVFPVGSSYTKTAWVYRAPGSTGHLNIMSSDSQSVPEHEHVFWITSQTDYELAAGHGGNRAVVRDSTGALAEGVWHHVAVSWDLATGDMVLYKNGAVVGTGNTTDVVGQTAVQVGAFAYSYGWHGSIDDAAIYPFVLSGDQIAALYANGDSNTVVAAETTAGEVWQCQVTPFSSSEAGPTEASDPIEIVPAAVPHFNVDVEGNQIWGHQWSPGELDIDIVGGPTLLVPVSDGSDGMEPGDFNVDLNEGSVWDLVAGEEVIVTHTSAPETKTHTATELTAFHEPATNTVDGTAAADSFFDVWVDETDPGVWRNDQADGSGLWSVDFAVVGDQSPEEDETIVLGPGNSGAAAQCDPDGDCTFAHWRVANPHFAGVLTGEVVDGWEWTPSDFVQVTVNTTDVEATVATDAEGNFHFEIMGYDLVPGDLVEVEDLATGRTKTHTMIDLVVVDVNDGANVITGTTDLFGVPDDHDLYAWIHDQEGEYGTTPNPGDGTWLVDFNPEDLAAGVSGGVGQPDADGDRTEVYWGIPNPSFSVESLFDVWSSGEGWVEGNTATLTVDDPSNGVGVDHTETVVVVDRGEEGIGFSFNTDPFEIHPGFEVSVDDGVTFKTLIVEDLTIDLIDEAASTVSGMGPADTPLQVDAGNEHGGCGFEIVSAPDGSYLADFSGEPCNLGPFGPGWGGAVQVFDDDGDSTHRGWNIEADTIPPVITLLGDNPLVHEAGDPFVDPGAEVTDNVDPTVTITGVSDVDPDVPGDYTITYDATDAAGNPALTVVRDVQVVDTTDPVVTITAPADGATYELNEVVLADYECTDSGSGIGSCVGDVADSSPIDTSTLGAHTFTVVGTDVATNETTVVHGYTVVDAGPATDIILVGDSITDGGYGSSDDTGYRRFLYLSLEATHGAAALEFVGSQDGPDLGDYDDDHEGHSGWDAHEVRDAIIGWLNSNPADIVTLHIGTNDINGGQSAEGVAAEINEILDNIDTWESTNHPVWVVLAQIVNRSNPTDTKGLETTALNGLIADLEVDRVGDQILVVDMESALVYPDDMDDTLHPNDSGYVKMAAVYDAAIDMLLGSGPTALNVDLTSTSGSDLSSDDLTCAFDLAGSATTAATAWNLDASPFATLVLPMEGGASTALEDISGNGNDLAPFGDPVWSATAGHDGNGAFVFDGTDDLHSEGVFPVGSSYTKTAWVYRTGSGASGGNNIITGDTNTGGHALWARESNGFMLSSGHNGSWKSVIDSEALALNTWYHVAVTWDSSTGLMSLYKNGAPVSGPGAIPTATVTTPVTDHTVNIGSFGSAGWSWIGTIDDPRVYPVALSADQIASLYATGDTTMVAAETSDGDDWQCQVTPYSASEAGLSVASNTVHVGPAGPDLTDPVVTITTPADAGTYGQGTVVAADYECTDSQSGIASCVGTVADGAPIDTSTLGLHSFTVDAEDNAGNTTSVTHNYTVEVYTGPSAENVILSSTSGSNLSSDDLSCAFDLAGSATTAGTAWSLNASPFATFVLPMEGGTLAALEDISGNGNDTIAVGDATWVASGGHDGNGAFLLDGSGDYLDAGDVFPVGSSYTKTAWVYRAAGSGGHLNIMSSDSQGDAGNPEHVLWISSQTDYELAAGHGGNRQVVRDTVALAEGVWYHVAVTWDLATGDMVLYKNGVVVDTGNTPTGVTQTAVEVGSFMNGTYSWDGSIDDARLYPVALSADQIASLYATGDTTMVAAETSDGDTWQCQVTPYSSLEAGPAFGSNTLTIGSGPVATGMLRVVSSPAVPTQILVDGVPMDTWGLQWVKVPVGSHTVSFTDVQGFTTPAPQVVAVAEDATTEVTGLFEQRGWLQVSTSPAVPSTISVDGAPMNDWGVWTDLPAGSYEVCYGDVADYAAPACETVSVTTGATTSVTGVFTSDPGALGPLGHGMLRVVTDPAVPAQILIDGLPADSWGLNWVKVAPGAHIVSFTDIEGFTTPADVSVTVVAGMTSVVTGSYVQRGGLQVSTSPAVPATIFVDGSPRDDWGMWTDLPAGSYQVCYGEVDGFTAPACEVTAVTAGVLTSITGVFTSIP